MKYTTVLVALGATAFLSGVEGTGGSDVNQQIRHLLVSGTRKTRGVRGTQKVQIQRERRLPKKPHGGSHHSSYSGCLSYSSEELEESWIFESSAPDCSYVHHSSGNGSGGDDDGSGGDDDSNNDDGGDDDGNVVVSNEDGMGDDDGGNQYDPMEDFLVEQCDTYENLWAWDLSLSCEDPSTLASCNCTFAEELFDERVITCEDASRCPEDCHICGTCFAVLGCQVGNTGGSGPRKVSTSTLLWIIGAVVLALLLGLAWYHTYKRRQEENELSKNLIAGEYKVGKSLSWARKGEKYPEGLHSTPFKPPSETPLNGAGLAVAGVAACGATSHSESDDSDSEAGSYDNTLPTVDESTVASTKVTGEAPERNFEDELFAVPEDEEAIDQQAQELEPQASEESKSEALDEEESSVDEVESEETYEGVDYADVPHDEQASDSSNAGGDEASEASLDQQPGEEPGACDNIGNSSAHNDEQAEYSVSSREIVADTGASDLIEEDFEDSPHDERPENESPTQELEMEPVSSESDSEEE